MPLSVVGFLTPATTILAVVEYVVGHRSFSKGYLLTDIQTIFVSAVFCLITPLGGAVAQTWEQLFITRLLMGIGMGLKGSSVPIFAAENSPARIRGALVMSWQMWTGMSSTLLMCTQSNMQFSIWYILGLLCQSCGLSSWPHRMASPDWFSLHSCSAVSASGKMVIEILSLTDTHRLTIGI